MNTKDGLTNVAFLKQLSTAGLDDALILRRDTAQEVLTDKRMELVDVIADQEPASKRELARAVDRDISIVSRDLDILFEARVIDYEQDGRSKRPVLTHDTVLIEPVVYEGDVAETATPDPEGATVQ
ncbi:HVO_A0114 family putative DNA-binding protein [Halostella litorea]|uniref:HVO_A0114 family putative DNA-binding protein n=1 Tax=Halostella litorea TaxID=2528831 RepID=UPI001F173443|nr:hypothetical protein [Halostella litorea]